MCLPSTPTQDSPCHRHYPWDPSTLVQPHCRHMTPSLCLKVNTSCVNPVVNSHLFVLFHQVPQVTDTQLYVEPEGGSECGGVDFHPALKFVWMRGLSKGRDR